MRKELLIRPQTVKTKILPEPVEKLNHISVSQTAEM